MSSETTAKTIELSGHCIYGERAAGGAIMPGHLLKVTGASAVVHNGEAGPALPIFALEELAGGTIDDAYASTNTVRYGVFAPGSVVNALLEIGSNATDGIALVSAGTGEVKIFTAAEGGTVIGYAQEAVNNSAGSAAARIKMMVGTAGYVAPVGGGT